MQLIYLRPDHADSLLFTQGVEWVSCRALEERAMGLERRLLQRLRHSFHIRMIESDLLLPLVVNKMVVSPNL